MRQFKSELGEFASPETLNKPIQIENEDKKTLVHYLKLLLTIRFVEEAISDMIEAGIARCPCHLGVGQEAIGVGVAAVLNNKDKVFGTHRAHAHYLGLGGDVYKLFSEVLGRVDGCSKGLGGSMHLFADDIGFHGSVPIVAGTIPIAVGAALATKMDNEGQVAVCFFGDGSVEEGVFHESMNIAASLHLPVLFVCENNFYSSHLDIKLRQPSDKISRYAEAHCIPFAIADGNNVLAVKKSAGNLVQAMRENNQPGFLEVITYRWKGHVGPKDDIDVGVRRKLDDLNAWKALDPIKRFKECLVDARIITEEEYKNLYQLTLNHVKACEEKAKQSPYPEASTLYDNLYAVKD